MSTYTYTESHLGPKHRKDVTLPSKRGRKAHLADITNTTLLSEALVAWWLTGRAVLPSQIRKEFEVS